MDRFLKIVFFGLIVKPVVLVLLGLNLRNRQLLPYSGPAILAANHNSHMDTMVLMSLYPLSRIHKVRPVAAADYFLTSPLKSWFSKNVIGIIPLERKGEGDRQRLFDECESALKQGDILIIFPEGSRGEPEQMSDIKKGVFHLANGKVKATITPVVMRGLGRVLPKGEALLVPFNCDVIVGERLPDYESASEFTLGVRKVYEELFEQCLTSAE